MLLVRLGSTIEKFVVIRLAEGQMVRPEIIGIIQGVVADIYKSGIGLMKGTEDDTGKSRGIEEVTADEIHIT